MFDGQEHSYALFDDSVKHCGHECFHNGTTKVLLDLALNSTADHHLRQPILVLCKSSCFDSDAVLGGSGAALAPITPGIIKTKLELEASNAIAGEPKPFLKC